MTWMVAGLVLTGAFFNASWNLLFKKASGDTAFFWLGGVLSALFYLPVAGWVLLVQKADVGFFHALVLMGCAALQVLYYILLGKGYQIGDLSVIYPLVRGTGPLLCTLAAILILDETPTMNTVAGTLFIIAGIVCITGLALRWSDSKTINSLLFALMCGTLISLYTVLDKVVLSVYLIPPLFMAWFSEFGRSVLLVPYATRNWPKIRRQWQTNRWMLIGFGLLGPLGYMMILMALSISSVSVVAPLREFSILIGVIMGTKFLAEEHAVRRLLGAVAMLIGLGSIAMG